MKAKKVYVVVEIGFEYNDEYYFTSEDESGEPIQVWESKARAETECAKMTIAAARKYGTSYIVNEGTPEEAAEYLKKLGFDEDEIYYGSDDNNLKNLTAAEITKLLKYANVRFYRVAEAEVME